MYGGLPEIVVVDSVSFTWERHVEEEGEKRGRGRARERVGSRGKSERFAGQEDSSNLFSVDAKYH